MYMDGNELIVAVGRGEPTVQQMLEYRSAFTQCRH